MTNTQLIDRDFLHYLWREVKVFFPKEEDQLKIISAYETAENKTKQHKKKLKEV